MRRLHLILFLLLFFVNHQVNAQITPFHGTVEIIEMGADSTFVFQVTSTQENKPSNRYLKTIAEKTVLYALLFDGVEGVNNDEKIVYRFNRVYFENLFENNYYHIFIHGTQILSKTKLRKKDTHLKNKIWECSCNVAVKYKKLCREMKDQKFTDLDNELKRTEQNEKTDFR